MAGRKANLKIDQTHGGDDNLVAHQLKLHDGRVAVRWTGERAPPDSFRRPTPDNFFAFK